MALITAAKPYQSFADKMSDFLVSQYPGQIDKASTKIFIGRNQDSAPGSDAGFRITGRARDAAPIYMETPDKMIPEHMIANKNDACGGIRFTNKVSDSAKEFIEEAIKGCMSSKGMTFEEAKILSVMDSVTPLNDTEQKKVLTGIIQDALSDPETVLAADDEAKKKLADSVDALYAKCKELDSESAAKIIEDACGGKDAGKPAKDADPEDDKGDEGKKDDKDDEGEKETKDGCGDGKTNDEDAIAKVVEAAVSKALDSAKIDEKVDAAVKKALNLDGAKTPEAKGAATDADINFNAEDCLPNGWGHR